MLGSKVDVALHFTTTSCGIIRPSERRQPWRLGWLWSRGRLRSRASV